MKLIFRAILLVAVINCGPEPSSPSDESLAGTWRSSAHLLGLSNWRLEIIQEPEGIVSGKWFAHGDGGPPCASEAPCEAFGNIIGFNSVSQVTIEILGAARFEGALVSTNQLRGALVVNTRSGNITFTRN